jgi:hypothetical protein
MTIETNEQSTTSHVAAVYAASATPIWEGTLADASGEFHATIVEDPSMGSGASIFRRVGDDLVEVLASEVASDYWLRALVVLANESAPAPSGMVLAL